MTEFTLKRNDDGIAVITWDVPGTSINVMSREGIAELGVCVEEVLNDASIKGAVITSGKKDFAAGMDLNILSAAKASDNPAQTQFDMVMDLHRLFRRIERANLDPKTNTGGKPIATALPGTTLGLGLELALASHRSFAADNPKAKIGLPEILVGIFPGGGGTVRLGYKLGIMGASPFLFEGKTVAPAQAHASGLIDEVVPADELLNRAKAWVASASDADIVKPWDSKGFKIPGGAPFSASGFPMFAGLSAMTHGKTRGIYPAAKAVTSVLYESMQVPIDTALTIEARWFVSVLLNPSSAAMINSLFLNKNALEKGAKRPKNVADQSVRKLGVLGAGLMGAGIAHVAAMAGIETVLLDQSLEASERGVGYTMHILDKAISRGRSTERKKEQVLSRLTATASYDDLKGCDLIVEAVFEDVGIKADVTKMAEAQLDEKAVFATNTSTLPIGQLSQASARPENFVGIHFFSPVERMALVEIIKGQKTGDLAIAKALDFVRQIRKTPIVVNDARNFYANRCIIPYLAEGNRMVAEGIAPALIENAAKQMGMPLGPLQLADEVSIELNYKIMQATKEGLGDEYVETPDDSVTTYLYEAGRLGKKANSGYYCYDKKGKREGLWTGMSDRFPLLTEQPGLEEVMNRLILPQVFEAIRALEDGVLEDIREGDVGAILGWGFMPWTGGPFGWIDILGASEVVKIAEDLNARHDDRFEIPVMLKKMAASGASFYETHETKAA